jgi:hypothetical protein
MKWLLWVNGAAALLYASFVAAVLIADVWILPTLDALEAPPPAVGAAIRQADDIDGLREIALVLFEHVSDQAQVVNTMVSQNVMYARLHFLLAFGIACANVALLLRLRRESSAGKVQ